MSLQLERVDQGQHPPLPFDGIDNIDNAAELCSWEITAPAPDGITVLWVAGEVDLFTLSILRAALAAGLDRKHHHLLVVDLSRLTFCGVAGLMLLERAGATAAQHGMGYAISGCSASLVRIWSLLGGAAPPVCHATVAEAVAAVRTDVAS